MMFVIEIDGILTEPLLAASMAEKGGYTQTLNIECARKFRSAGDAADWLLTYGHLYGTTNPRICRLVSEGGVNPVQFEPGAGGHRVVSTGGDGR